jgi:hypothetical protein
VTDAKKLNAAVKRSQQYLDSKGKKIDGPSIGFIIKNDLSDLSDSEIDVLLSHAKSLNGGIIVGYGDRFKEWCVSHGRDLPTDSLIDSMNRNPYNSEKEVRKLVVSISSILRSFSTFRAGSR